MTKKIQNANSTNPEPAKRYRGVDVANLRYYVKDRFWKIREDGHLPKYADEIIKAGEEFSKLAEDLSNGKGKLTAMEVVEKGKECNKKILSLALYQDTEQGHPDGWNYDAEVQNLGYKVIEGMAIDLKLFLADYGGKDEYLHFKGQLSTGTQSGFRSIEV